MAILRKLAIFLATDNGYQYIWCTFTQLERQANDETFDFYEKPSHKLREILSEMLCAILYNGGLVIYPIIRILHWLRSRWFHETVGVWVLVRKLIHKYCRFRYGFYVQRQMANKICFYIKIIALTSWRACSRFRTDSTVIGERSLNISLSLNQIFILWVACNEHLNFVFNFLQLQCRTTLYFSCHLLYQIHSFLYSAFDSTHFLRICCYGCCCCCAL